MTQPTPSPPSTSDQSTVDNRIVALDAVRGVAVLGILVMNIVAMGLPNWAYVDPTYYGLRGPTDIAAWALAYVFVDGKMRALFTMLFGASMLLIAERAEANGRSPAATHYSRLVWLLAFGMIHAWLLWYGDILVPYAVCGAIGFFLWRWEPARLWVFFAFMIAVLLLLDVDEYLAFSRMDPAVLAADPADAAREVLLYRGGLAQVFEARSPMTFLYQTSVLPQSVPEILAFMALGILFLRNGFLAGRWTRAAYRRTAVIGYLVAAPLHLPLIWLLLSRDFAPAALPLADMGSLALRPFMALAHASVVILLVTSGEARWLTTRLEAAGRMAFSNYLGSTLVATTLFYGYGLGLFGSLSRAQLYIPVAAIWVLILLWSKPWLDRYRYGPLEWLWRSLARGKVQPMLRRD